jgi:hypothetical protein
MQLSFKDLQFIVGNESTIENMQFLRPLRPFSDEVIDFFNALSRRVLQTGKAQSDTATFGFWCRKAALLKEKRNYDDLEKRLGKGVVFHSTPSNVPVNFAFSFAAGLLAGNANIVRLPAKSFTQVDVICDQINRLILTEFVEIAPYVCMVKYQSNRDITDTLSGICDSRIIWGGDDTIANMRRSVLKARATDITFADRYSIAVIQADEYLKIENKSQIALDFYNDTYFSDQNACTAPRLIVWLGDNKSAAKTIFWNEIHQLAVVKYNLTPVQAVGKLAAFYKAAVNQKVRLEVQPDNIITRINVSTLDEELLQLKYNSGFFFEYDAESLYDILPVCGQRCQTLTYLGITKEEIEYFFENCKPQGIDRAVPVGKSMDFSLVWDGYDLIRELSRKYTIM